MSDRHLTKHLIVSVSGSGKSTLAADHPRQFIDGDDVTYATLPDLPHRWWQDPSLVPAVHDQVDAALVRHFASGDDRAILFFHPLERLRRVIPSDWSLKVALVSPDVLARNLRRRAESGSTGQPTDVPLMLRHQRQLAHDALASHIPIIPFSELI